MSGNGFSVFPYDDGSMILYRYVKDEVNPAHITVHTTKEVKELKEVVTGRSFPARRVEINEDFERRTEYVADVILEPGVIYKGKWE